MYSAPVGGENESDNEKTGGNALKSWIPGGEELSA